MKKIISLAAAVIMLVTTVFSNTVFAAFSDVSEDTKYSKAISTLTKLNVINGYDDGTFQPEASISRAEFTKIVVYTLGLDKLQVELTEFEDVSADHWAKYFIKTAYDKKIIDGYGDGNFGPNDNVTYEQALKMIVCTLGYGTYAEQQGGYPVGYQTQAGTLGLTKGISGVAYSEPAPRGVIAQIVSNALEIEIKEFNSDTSTYESSGKTLLNDYLGVKKFKGELAGAGEHVTANCVGSLLPGQMQMVNTADSSDYVIIDYTKYTEDITDITKHLGKLVTVYYEQKRSSDEAVLVAIDDETTKNTEYVINSSDIDTVNSSSIRYYENGGNNAKNLSVNFNNVTVRYNGKVVSGLTKLRNKSYTSAANKYTTETYSAAEAVVKWLSPASEYFIYGDVVLLDRESDGKIDDIQINDYQTMVALKTPTTTDYKISDKLKTGNSLVLNPDSTTYTSTIIKNDKAVEITAISANDVILYAESLDESLYTLYVTNTKVSGKVTMVNGDTVKIDGEEYRMSDICRNYISDKQSGAVISTNQKVSLYTDKYNTLVYGEVEAEKEKEYAYITTAYQEKGTGDQYISAFIPSQSSSGVKNYKLKDKVSLNGSSLSASVAITRLAENAAYTNKDLTTTSLKNAIYGASYSPDEDAYRYSQLARIEINSSGEVSSIITLDDDTTAASNENTSVLERCRDLQEYTYGSSTFRATGSQFSINSSTVIIYVPGDRSRTGVSKKTSSAFSTSEKYYVEAYDVNSSRYAGAVVLYGTGGSKTAPTKTTDYSVIADEPGTSYDESLEKDINILSLYKGASTTLQDDVKAADDVEFADVNIGDVILYSYDKDGYICDRIDCIRYDDIAEVLNGDTFDWTATQTASEENNWQSKKFDYNFKNKSHNTEWYTSSELGDIPYSRAAMFNVSEVLEDESKIVVSQGGFDDEGNLTEIAEEAESILTVSSSTKIFRIESDAKGISPYVEDTETALTISDLKDAKNYGTDCSKILVIRIASTIKAIVIYG